ncbi:MAG: PQQ-dependent sugar dehydrogenase [Candidatus Rokubacteria bacterium]|nr:PQQ-dependent sugar dehydrogenase [Candidatus Rokubacteria bacterium]
MVTPPRRPLVLVVALLALGLVTAGLAGPAAAQIQVQQIATGLPSPIGITHAPDGSGRLFINLQRGKIVIWDGTKILPKPFLDLTSLVTCCGEQGLLGVAFHPDYTTNGFFFVFYTNSAGNTAVVRYRVSADPDVANPASALPILSIAQPEPNHNGGQLQFGPDGYLYIGVGDGGGSGDPQNRSQNRQELLGKILRIDVDRTEGGKNYAIPPTNPFADNTNGWKEEIWAYGLRHPWRFSFDRATDDLWIGDVGQNEWEEVNFEAAGSAGGLNYGWRRMEGKHCFNPPSNCNPGTLVLPVLEYSHSLGCSITGGYRYRGSAYPALVGTYFYADYCSGRIWGATENGAGSFTSTQLLGTSLSIVSFGESEDGELFLAHLDEPDGAIYRVVGTASANEIVIDNAAPGVQDAAGGRTFTGSWCLSSVGGGFGGSSLYSCGSARDTYRFTPNIQNAGTYDVYVRWTPSTLRSTTVPIAVVHAGGTTTKLFNQETGGTTWVKHGQYVAHTGKNAWVEVSDLNGQASADAVRFVRVGGLPTATLTVSLFGSGTVQSAPAGIACPGDCTQAFTVGTTVTVTATAAAGSQFTGWGGPCSGTAPCTLTMDGAKFLAANFSPAGGESGEVVLDNAPSGVQDAAHSFTGTWCVSGASGAYGANSLYSCSSNATYTFRPTIPATRAYDAYVRWTAHANRSSSVPISVVHSGGTTAKNFNQKVSGSTWVLHGRYTFAAGTAGRVTLSNANGQAAADAIRLVPQ